MVATTFASGDSVITSLVADLKAAILTSTDYSNPSGSRVLATTTRGSDICVELSGSAPTSVTMQLTVYRTAALGDATTRYIHWRLSGGATSDTVHWMVSAGKEHLYISVEGPRAGEINAVNSATGSPRTAFFIGDITPYHASDTVPAVILVANPNASGTAWASGRCWVSRNQTNNASWVTAKLATVTYPVVSGSTSSAISWVSAQHLAAGDGKFYMWPYLVIEDTDGLRGRLAKLFYLGGNGAFAGSDTMDNFSPTFARYTYSGETYISVPVTRYTTPIRTPFGAAGASDPDSSPLIAIPYS